MRIKALSYLPLVLLCAACSTSKYGVMAPKPTLSVSMQEGPYCAGNTYYADISVRQEGVKDGFSLSAVLVTGQAEAARDGVKIPISGEWIRLSESKVRIAITPLSAGGLTMDFQAQSADGVSSEKYTFQSTIQPAAEIATELIYDARHINTPSEVLIPIHLKIEKPGYTGKYTLTPSIEKGKGTLYHDEYMVNDIPFEIGSTAEIYYKPSALGEQIFNFKIEAGKFSTTVRAYMDVIRKISVACDLQGGFSISGSGEYNTEGKEVVLKLLNDDLYNFEVAGWYEPGSGKLLSSQESYTLKLATDCITELTLRLKQRAVQITMQNPVTQEFQYLIQVDGKPVVKTGYDYRTQLSADYKVSEPIKFFYEESRYDQSTIPPTPRKGNAAPAFGQGTTKSGYLYRIDRKFKVYLRKTDNPGFTFNTYDRCIESSSTKYSIPSNITIQN